MLCRLFKSQGEKAFVCIIMLMIKESTIIGLVLFLFNYSENKRRILLNSMELNNVKLNKFEYF